MFQYTACDPDKWEKLKVDFMYEYIYRTCCILKKKIHMKLNGTAN